MQSRKASGVYLRFGDEKLKLGRANVKLRRVSCLLSSIVQRRDWSSQSFKELAQDFAAGSGRAGCKIKPRPLATSSQKLAVCSKAIPGSYLFIKFYIESFISELGDNGVWGLILSGLASSKGIEAGAGRSKEC